MYQALYYNRETKLYHLRTDDKGWVEFKYRPLGYVKNPNGDVETIDGVKVSPTLQYNYKDPDVYESDVDRLTRVLVDAFYEEDNIPTYHNLVYIDIENEIAGTLTQDSVREASTKITAISLYDNNTKEYYCYILDGTKTMESSENESKYIVPCSSEKELLLKFINKWEEIDPTIICGYNSEFFDIPYLYSRMSKILGSHHAVRLSPLKKVDEGDFMGVKYTKIAGVNHLDYMLLFKKYITAQEPSYKLGDIGTKYVNLGKIEYNGSLDRLYREDINKFIEYNIRDVEILVALEEKFKFIELTIIICHLCHTVYEQIYMSTALNEGAILTYLKRKNIVSPNKPTTYNPELKELKEEYAGGYLLDPVPGLYSVLIDEDLVSLYPTIIRTLNLGIETYIGHITNRSDKNDCWWGLSDLKEMDGSSILNIESKNGKISSLTVKKLIELIEHNNLTIAASGAMFRTDVKSVVSEILEDWFNKRVEYKNLMKKSYKSGDKAKGDFYNRYQQAFKIKLNDVYGCYAINSWRYSDGRKILSAAITLSGQRIIKESIREANNMMDKMMED